MKDFRLSSLFKPIGKAFQRFHLMLLFLLVVAGLAYAVLLFNDILTQTNTAEDYTSPISAGSIDQATLERIQQLHTSSEKSPELGLPAGRTNPFDE